MSGITIVLLSMPCPKTWLMVLQQTKLALTIQAHQEMEKRLKEKEKELGVKQDQQATGAAAMAGKCNLKTCHIITIHVCYLFKANLPLRLWWNARAAPKRYL